MESSFEKRRPVIIGVGQCVHRPPDASEAKSPLEMIEEAIAKAQAWLLDKREDRHFLINAAPGAGKTLASCALAKLLIEKGEIDPKVFHAGAPSIK